MGRTPDHYGGGSGADRVWSSFQPRSVRRMSRPCSGLVTEWWRPPASHTLRAVDGPYGAGDGVPRAECAGAADHYRQRPLQRLLNRYGEKPRARSLRGCGSCRRSPPGGWCRAGSGTGPEQPRSCAAASTPPRLVEAADTTLPETMARSNPLPASARGPPPQKRCNVPLAPRRPPSAASTCPSRSATSAAAPPSRCFSRWSRTEGSATAPPSSCSAAGRRTAGPTAQPHRPSAARPRGAAFGRSPGQTALARA